MGKKFIITVIILVMAGMVAGVFWVAVRSRRPEPSSVGQSSPIPSPVLRSDINAAEREILTTAAGEGDDQAWQKYPDLVAAEAEEAPYLDITGCAPTPVAFRVKDKAAFRVRHKDAAERVLFFTETDKKVIPAGDGVDIAADFDGPGGYSYRCGGTAGPIVGVIYVTP